jgi:hypothetical protein
VQPCPRVLVVAFPCGRVMVFRGLGRVDEVGEMRGACSFGDLMWLLEQEQGDGGLLVRNT